LSKGVQVQRLGLTRTYGPFEATLKYSIDRNNNDHTVAASFRPTAIYRNVVVPSHDLLVPSAEVTSDGESPEERNFDPFDLLKQRKTRTKKKDLGPGKSNENAPPPPVPPSDQDLPTPATPPPADKRTEAPETNDDARSFADPRKIDTKKRPDRVDRDEWTTPPPEPASTR
jgi:type IV secretory pathway VirB10-like protein